MAEPNSCCGGHRHYGKWPWSWIAAWEVEHEEEWCPLEDDAAGEQVPQQVKGSLLHVHGLAEWSHMWPAVLEVAVLFLMEVTLDTIRVQTLFWEFCELEQVPYFLLPNFILPFVHRVTGRQELWLTVRNQGCFICFYSKTEQKRHCKTVHSLHARLLSNLSSQT